VPRSARRKFIVTFQAKEPHIYIRDGKPLFAGTPDRKLIFPKRNLTILIDRKFGRGDVPKADVNMQIRCYLAMVPKIDFEEADGNGVPYGVSGEFRPSSMLRLKLCPGSLALQRQMTAQGLSGDDPSEDAAEGTVLHKAMADPKAPRDHLEPEQFDTVEEAERMEREFIEFALASDKNVRIYGAIVQPRVRGKADSVFYTESDIAMSRMEINGIWDDAHAENAPRNASSDACKFCPAKAICPEYRSWVMAVERISHLPAATWTPQQWELFLSRRSELTKFLEDRYDDAKAIVAVNPEAIPGWELKDGAEMRHLVDLPAAWTALSDIFTAKDFSESCKFQFGEAEKILWRTRSGTPQKVTHNEAKAIINAKLQGNVELRRKAPSLVRKKA